MRSGFRDAGVSRPDCEQEESCLPEHECNGLLDLVKEEKYRAVSEGGRRHCVPRAIADGGEEAEWHR